MKTMLKFSTKFNPGDRAVIIRTGEQVTVLGPTASKSFNIRKPNGMVKVYNERELEAATAGK